MSGNAPADLRDEVQPECGVIPWLFRAGQGRRQQTDNAPSIVGTYVVNPDCTGTSSVFIPGLPFPIEHAFVIVDNGRQVKEAVMSPLPNVISVALDRQ